MVKKIILGVVVLFCFSCKKYAYDKTPKLHLRTITNRLCGKWEDITHHPSIYTFTFKKNGEVSVLSQGVGPYSKPGENFQLFEGKWTLSSDKQSIVCDYGIFTEKLYIARLDNKEMWFGEVTYVKYKKTG